MFTFLQRVARFLLHFVRQCGLIAGQAHCVHIDPSQDMKNTDRDGSRMS
jgi:hypothetical protein